MQSSFGFTKLCGWQWKPTVPLNLLLAGILWQCLLCWVSHICIREHIVLKHNFKSLHSKCQAFNCILKHLSKSTIAPFLFIYFFCKCNCIHLSGKGQQFTSRKLGNPLPKIYKILNLGGETLFTKCWKTNAECFLCDLIWSQSTSQENK